MGLLSPKATVRLPVPPSLESTPSYAKLREMKFLVKSTTSSKSTSSSTITLMAQFEELLENESIKSLSGSDAEVVELLSTFTTTDAKDFKNQLTKYSSLLKKESITEE